MVRCTVGSNFITHHLLGAVIISMWIEVICIVQLFDLLDRAKYELKEGRLCPGEFKTHLSY